MGPEAARETKGSLAAAFGFLGTSGGEPRAVARPRVGHRRPPPRIKYSLFPSRRGLLSPFPAILIDESWRARRPDRPNHRRSPLASCDWEPERDTEVTLSFWSSIDCSSSLDKLKNCSSSIDLSDFESLLETSFWTSRWSWNSSQIDMGWRGFIFHIHLIASTLQFVIAIAHSFIR